MKNLPHPHRLLAAVNVRFLIGLLLALALGGGAFVGIHYFQKRSRAAAGLAEANAAVAKQDWVAAWGGFQKYLRQYPDDVTVLRQYCDALMKSRPYQREHVQRTIEGLRRIHRLDPDDVAAHHDLMRLYYMLPDYSNLLYIAEKRVANDPLAQFFWARGKFKQDRFDDAAAAIEKLLPAINQPKTDEEKQLLAEVCVLKHLLLQKRGVKDVAELQAPLKQALAADPNSFEPAIRLAQLAREQAFATRDGTPDAAKLDEAKKALLALKPVGPLHQVLLGLELVGVGELDRAEALLKESQAQPDMVGPRDFALSADAVLAQFMLRAQIDLSRAKTGNGVEIVDTALRELPDKSYRALALPDAIRLCLLDRECAVEAGDRERSAKALAKVDELLKEYKSALDLVERKPAKHTIAVLEALQAQAKGEYHTVIALLEPHEKVQAPDRADVLGLLADAYGRVGRSRRAAESIAQYRAAGGSDRRELQIQQLQWLVEQGNWDEAARLTAKWTDLSDDDVERAVLVQKVKLRAGIAGDAKARAQTIADVSAALAPIRARHADAIALRELEAEVLTAEGKFDEAGKIVRAMTDAKPDSPRAWRARADFLATVGNEEELIDVLRQWTQRTPAESEPWKRLSDALARKRDFPAAIAALNDGMVAVDPALVTEFKLKLGLLDLQRGETQAGEAKLQALADANPKDGIIRRRWLERIDLRDAAAAQRAQPIIDRLREIEGDSGTEWRIFQAEAILATRPSNDGRREAINLLLPIVEADTRATRAVLLLGEAYERNRDWDAAERLYKMARAANPKDVLIGQRLAQLYKSRGRETEFREIVKSEAFPASVRVAQSTIELIERGELSAAVRELDDYLKDQPADVEARVLRVQLQYRQTSDVAAALREIDEADKLNPGHPQIFRTRIALLEAAGRADDARKLIDERLAAKPDFETHELRGSFLEALGDFAAAEADFKKLPELAPDSEEGYMRLGIFYYDRQRMDDAAALLGTAARKFSNSREIKRALAKTLLARNAGDDRAQAVKLIEDIERGPDGVRDPELIKLRAFALLDSGGDRAPAKKLLEESVEGNPMQLDAHRALIELALDSRDYATARIRAEKAREFFSKDPTLAALSARIERESGTPDRAVLQLREAIEANPGSIECLREMAVLTDNGLIPAAELVSRTEKALPLHPKDSELAVIRARSVAQAGRLPDAIAGLEKFRAEYPQIGGVPVLLTLADLAARVPDPAAVAKYLDSAAQLGPKDDTARRARIVWLASQNKVAEIAELMRSPDWSDAGPFVVAPAAERLISSGEAPLRELAIERLAAVSKTLAADHPGQLDLAGLLFAAGDADRALAIHEAFLAVRPDEPRLLNDMAWILATARQRYDEALKKADRGVALDPQNPDLRDTRGTILLAQGNPKAAATDFRQAAATYQVPASKARAWLQAARCHAKADPPSAAELRSAIDAARELDNVHKVFTDAERAELNALAADAAQ